MIESDTTRTYAATETRFTAASGGPFPTLDRTLTIARLGSRDPASLSPDDVKDLSRVVLMQYARMGIA